MTIMAQPNPRFACRAHHPVTTAALVILFWTIAALLVVTAHRFIEPRSPVVGAAAAMSAMVLTAFCYSRFVAWQAGASHALGVGIAWLVLSIAAELIVGARTGHNWFYLLDSPDHPLFRNIDLFIWIFAPVLFARREDIS